MTSWPCVIHIYKYMVQRLLCSLELQDTSQKRPQFLWYLFCANKNFLIIWLLCINSFLKLITVVSSLLLQVILKMRTFARKRWLKITKWSNRGKKENRNGWTLETVIWITFLIHSGRYFAWVIRKVVHLCRLKKKFQLWGERKCLSQGWERTHSFPFKLSGRQQLAACSLTQRGHVCLLHCITPCWVPVQCHYFLAHCNPSVTTALGVHGSVPLSIWLLTAFCSPSCLN